MKCCKVIKRSSCLSVALFIALSFCSCLSYRMVGIEMYQPASITFSPEIRTVMIVNNAAQQPDDYGHQFIYFQHKDSTLSVSADSMAYYFCRSLGGAIAESPLFDDVRLCDDTLRHDSLFYITQPLTVRDVESLCEQYDVDALITLDKIVFKTVLVCEDKNTYIDWNMLNVEVTGELKALWPGKNIAHTIPFIDSLVWAVDYYHPAETFTVHDLQSCMRYLSEHTGHNMHMHFVPYWLSSKRWYYTSVSSDWKRATAYAVVEKWEQAAEIWQSLYHKTTPKNQKARLASNLALFHEMKGDFPKAIEYADQAHTIFQEITVEDDMYRKMQKSYLEILNKRLEDERVLTEQLREKK